MKKIDPPVRLLALNWSFDQPLSTIHRICSDRIIARGDNHQSLHADTLAKTHEDILWQFLHHAEELTDVEMDETVEMDLSENLEEALARAVDACVRILGVERPSQERMGEALAAARAYTPSTKKPNEDKKAAAAEARYFGLLAEIDLDSALNGTLEEDTGSESGKEFWDHLCSNNRIASRPHVTIVHSKNLPKDTPLWDRCKALHALPRPPLFKFRLSHLVWNDRIMAAVVSDLAVCSDGEDPDENGVQFIAQLPLEVLKRLHITVGTRDKDVNPVEAKDLVEQWKAEEDIDHVRSVELKDVWVKGRVKGLNT